MSNKNRIRRVILVANTTWNIFNFRQNIIQRLLQEGIEVFVFAPVDQYIEYKEKYPTVTHINLRTLDRDSTSLIKNLLLIEELRRKYKRINPDLIIHYTHKPNIFGTIAARLGKYKCISVVTGLGYSFINKGLINEITKLLYKFSSRYNSKMLFENEDDKNLFIENHLISSDQAVSIKGCGVDTRYYDNTLFDTLVDQKQTTFTFIGRLLKDKGIEEYAKAANFLKQKYNNLNFVVIGDFDAENPSTIDRDQLLKWISNDVIDYKGFVNDVRPIIHSSSCVVLPSYREGMPRIVLEAMSMSKPIITTRTAGCRETIEEEKNGFLVEIKNAESLIEGIEKFLKLSAEQRLQMGKASRERAITYFADDIIADTFYNIITAS